jgi:hypothetical protein
MPYKSAVDHLESKDLFDQWFDKRYAIQLARLGANVDICIGELLNS